MAEIIRGAIEDRLAEVHTILPGRIESFDAGAQKADVQPMLRRLQKTIDGELNEELPVIPSVPVVFPRAGGFKITFPVAEGDRCALLFCERSIDNYQVGGSDVTDPESFQMHDLSDAVCLLGWYPDTDALSAAVASDGMEIGEDDGPIIHIGNDQVNLYEKTAADFVALAQKVLSEHQKMETFWSAFLAALQAPIAFEPGNGAPSVFQAQLITFLTSNSYPSPASVAADKVKAT